jgi:hypothetical protein
MIEEAAEGSGGPFQQSLEITVLSKLQNPSSTVNSMENSEKMSRTLPLQA